MFKSFNPVYALLLALLAAFLHNSTQSDNSITHQLSGTGPSKFTGNILLLTAHPDDECMFFAPTILALAALQRPSASSRDPTSTSSLYSLCLSVGNADGLGAIRKYELESSLDILGVDTDKRSILDHPELQDNFTASWDAHTIATVLRPYVLKNRINTILTFDREGISGHPNHKSLPVGVKHLMSSLREVRLFTLITTPTPLKYASILAPTLAKFDLYAGGLLHWLEAQLTSLLVLLNVSISPPTPPPSLEVMPVFVSGTKDYWTALQAMRAHPSQLVWFRWLYVSFSRYMWVNEWNEVKVA
ncbi:putative deacetylase LmbE-like domain-containing protein [Favolaschia claudopus]|uniref:N-acetylglucosaminylphosphatidylinositol deacetylase n=1 Tax=Favolaschia claudopus TaxID=2862362 RepID=A0AAW0DKF8_9AGAR